ncbi:MAG TPA: Rho termination factor N-terminal domain-containing protein [Miltoncostaeaceae bacterium]|nr:Rho termination factor N-terminal domain-containing protein [Miltoncostaeaceae bacterium]
MATTDSGLRDMKVDELRARAREMEISGASSMKKDQLIAAIEKAGGGAGGRGRAAQGPGDLKGVVANAKQLHQEEERLVAELHTREREALKAAPVDPEVRRRVEDLIAQEEKAIKDMHAQIRALMKDAA